MAETNQRNAYGKTLVELCRENKNIVVLDADLGGSTMGKMVEVEPGMEERHIHQSIHFRKDDRDIIGPGLCQALCRRIWIKSVFFDIIKDPVPRSRADTPFP